MRKEESNLGVIGVFTIGVTRMDGWDVQYGRSYDMRLYGWVGEQRNDAR